MHDQSDRIFRAVRFSQVKTLCFPPTFRESTSMAGRCLRYRSFERWSAMLPTTGSLTPSSGTLHLSFFFTNPGDLNSRVHEVRRFLVIGGSENVYVGRSRQVANRPNPHRAVRLQPAERTARWAAEPSSGGPDSPLDTKKVNTQPGNRSEHATCTSKQQPVHPVGSNRPKRTAAVRCAPRCRSFTCGDQSVAVVGSSPCPFATQNMVPEAVDRDESTERSRGGTKR